MHNPHTMPDFLSKNLRQLSFSVPIKRLQLTPNPPPLDLNRTSTAAASSTTTPNYNSLYDFIAASPPNNHSTPSPPMGVDHIDDIFPSSSYADPEPIPDFAALQASNRFFFSSPGRSNSIVDSSSSSSSLPVQGFVAVHTYSPDPYKDFRQSMEEMMEARDFYGEGSKLNWDYLNELLFSYLSLNPKCAHEFIFRAFADLLVGIFSADRGGGNGTPESKAHGGCAV